MAVTIGAKRESDFTDPLGMLSDCHRRVERFLRVLIDVTVQEQGAELSTEQQAALEAGLRYFREAAPKHTADEEESLFPRLAELYQRHIHIEDNKVFPAASAILNAEDRKAIGEEMAARRKIGAR
jgi:hemerythrin-like domain-containing protein